MNLSQIAAEWREAKHAEQIAVDRRRQLEDQMLSLIGLPEAFEGTENAEAPGFKIKLVGRMNRTIDGDKLQEIAAENGLTEHLSALFRWKPAIDARAWKAADETITRPLLGAITTKPGRPSFSIEPTEGATS